MNEQTTTGLSFEPSSYTPADSADPADSASPAESADADANAAPTSRHPQPERPERPVRRRARTRPPKATDAPAEDAYDARETPTRKRRRVIRNADSGRMPALRLNRMDGRERPERRPTMVYDTQHAPGYLRILRLFVGLALLALAWGASLVVATVAISLKNGLPQPLALSERFGLYALSALAIAWLAVVAIGLIVVGALSLSLALTRRGW